SKEIGDHLCGGCLRKERYFTIARSIGVYEGLLREAIHRWKYKGKTSLNAYFGKWMAEGLSRYWNPNELDLLIPVPLHKTRLRDRGFNQALLLAKEIHSKTGIPYLKRALQKRKPTPPQVNLSGLERERGVRGAFEITPRDQIHEKSILLIDDVYTTGATVNECAKVLLKGGAKRVDVLTLARTVKTS
ncbi:MAG: ComF family protein, partial [Thermodesulfobacteriota bacterium]